MNEMATENRKSQVLTTEDGSENRECKNAGSNLGTRQVGKLDDNCSSIRLVKDNQNDLACEMRM